LPVLFEARGSVEQVHVSGAKPGAQIDLLGVDSSLGATGIADDQGTLIFRHIEPAEGYAAATGSGDARQVSEPVTVTSPDDHPTASFYESKLVSPGYGYMETRDGTLLAVNVVLPGPPDQGPYPTVVEYSGYDPANPDSQQPGMLVAGLLGYATIGVNMRGTGCSGGAFDYFETLQTTDGYDVIETVAAQPWVKDHRVGMVGVSYPGISQLFVAQTQPPHLAAITPLSVISDSALGTLYPGGILNNGFAVDWAQDRQHDAQPGGQPWAQARMDAGDRICIDNQRFRGQTPDITQLIEDNPFYDPNVADPLAPVKFVDRITVPVFLAGAWQDEQTGGYFPTMLDHFTGTDKLHFTLINGGHADSLGPEIMPRWFEFLSFYVAGEIPKLPTAAIFLLQTLSREVFGTELTDVPPNRFMDAGSFEEALAEYEAEPPVRVLFENGAGGEPGAPYAAFEYSFDTWPVRDLDPAVWYFAADGRLDPSPPVDEGEDSFVYDTSASQRTTCEGCGDDVWLALPDWDWQPLESGKALAYATDPLSADLVMAGSGSVDLWLRSTAPDVDIQVTLSEIRPDGQEVYVQNGWLRASHRKLNEAVSTELRPVQTHLREDAAELPAGEFASVRVELFPFAHVFRAGSRIRISVEAPGGDRPLWKFRALAPEGEVVNTIGRAPGTPSRVVLPLLPGLEVPTDLPPCPALRGQPCRPYVPIDNDVLPAS